MDKETIEYFKKSGQISATALEYGRKLIKPGVRLIDVCDKVEEKIRSLGGGLAFPCQVSINDVAAHYCPSYGEETVFEEGQLVKLDCGATYDGYVSDNAVSINLGDHENTIKASREALNAALNIIRPGVSIGEIGRTIQETIEQYGCSPVRNLSGHGIGRFTVHKAPSIPNFDTGNEQKLQEGMVIAVEPFASTGAGLIYESGNPTVFMQHAEKNVRSQFARDLLKTIKTYEGLPFTTRWLIAIHGEGKTNFGLRELINAGIIRGYPPLPDQKGGFVAQSEHSVIVMDKPIVITKLD